MRAVGSCFPKGPQYPTQPLHLLKDDGALTETEIVRLSSEEAKAKANQDMITAQVIHAQAILKKQIELRREPWILFYGSFCNIKR